MRKWLWLVGVGALVLVGLRGSEVAAQSLVGDFGDAPDLAFGDRFPTRADSTNADLEGWTGPVHLDTTQEWLGATVSREDAPTADDADDGWDPFAGTVTVTLADDAPAGPRYLNVVIDHNNSGHWNTTRTNQEWAVQNLELVQDAGTSVAHAVPLSINAGRWVRFTLTREPISAEGFAAVGGWDGSGPAEGFPFGETEDYRTTSTVRPPLPPVTIASNDCGLVISLLNNLTWFRAREGYTLEQIQAELPTILAQIEPLDAQAQPAIDAFFAALEGQASDDYTAVFAATEAARATWTGCEQQVNVNACGVIPYLYARFFSSPSVESEFVDELANTAVLQVMGQSEDGAWVQVRMPNGFAAWVPMVLVAPYCVG